MFILLALQHFSLGFVVSLTGTLPPGTINIETIRLGMQQSLATALRFVLATLIAELLYTFVAIHFSAYLMSFPKLEQYITMLTVPVFLVIGISYFFIKTPVSTSIESTYSNNTVFWKGLILGFVNPLQIPFWLTWTTYFLSLDWIKQDAVLLTAMTVGALAGSFTMLFLFARFGSTAVMKKLNVRVDRVNLFLGILLVGLACYQCVLLWGALAL